jgi:hypothetical protein
MWVRGHMYIHDKSDGAMGKPLICRQLPRSFFPACGLEIKIDHHQKMRSRKEAGEV